MTRAREIIEFTERYRKDVIRLWTACGLTRPWNNPDRDIDRCLSDRTGRIFLLVEEECLLGSVMAGYDGHRGAVYYLCVHPDWRDRQLGRMLMDRAEQHLLTLGCPKLNLMVRTTNLAVIRFYERLGYRKDDVVVMSKRLINDTKDTGRTGS